MKNLLLIAFATVAMFMGANVVDACPSCETKAKKVVEADKKADKKADKAAVKSDKKADTAEVKSDKKDVKDADAVADTKGACQGSTAASKAAAGQLVKADRACGSGCGGCGSGCGGCDSAKAAKATKDCGGCDSKKADKVVKN